MKVTPYIQYKHSLYTGVFKRVFKKIVIYFYNIWLEQAAAKRC